MLFEMHGNTYCQVCPTPNIESKEMYKLLTQQERKQVHRAPIDESSVSLQVKATYDASDCCHQHNVDSQND
jgi:hypothetical protein